MPRLLLTSLLFLTILTAGCGGGGSNPSSNSQVNSPASASSNPAPTSAPAAPQVLPPTVVTLTPGATKAGIDITVGAPASSPAVNALNLGTMSAGFASNTGAAVPRGGTQTIILFGPGLTADMTITISGPNDIGISNARPITAKTGAPGVAFDAQVPGSAAPGARTVFLRSASNDITTFVGGLEIQ